MDEILTRIINEKELVNELLTKGIAGWSVEDIGRGWLYRILDKEGELHEAVNLSNWSIKKLKLK